MGLLRGDLTALGNLATKPAGRRALFATGTGLLLLAVMSWWLGAELLARPQLLALLQGSGERDALRTLLGKALLPGPIAATWLGLSLAQRQLFEAGELPLWRQAPIAPWRPAVQVYLRALFAAFCWALALAAPFTLLLLQRAAAPATAYLLALPLLVAAVAPVLATLLAVQVILVRCFAGRWLRLAFAALAALASVGFSTWLLVGLFTPGPQRWRELAHAAAGGESAPWGLDLAARALAAAARGQWDTGAWLGTGGVVLAGLALFGVAAWLHPAACERQLLAEPLLRWRHRHPWPAGTAAALRRKEFAQVLQQPGALLGFLVFAFLVFALCRERVLIGGILANPYLPPAMAQLGALLALWFLAVLLVLYAHMGRLVLWDGPQWLLYTAAPTPPGAVLRGKLQAVALFLCWPLLLVAVAGVQVLGIDAASVLRFVGLAVPGTLCALGVLAVVGTSPRLMQPDAGGQIVQGGRSFLAAMLLVLLFEAVVSPAVFTWLWAVDAVQYHGWRGPELGTAWPYVLAGGWLWGLAVGAGGLWLGGRNFRRLTRPQP